MRICPVCKRQCLEFELIYEEIGCGGDTCPLKEEYYKVMNIALWQQQKKTNNPEYDIPEGVESWRDLVN